jgi:uncharacterized protein
MKIYRSELERGFQNKLFDIPADELRLNDVQVEDDRMECTLSAKPIPEGFRLSGILKIRFLESCDRCLESFVDKHTSHVNCILTPNEELIDGLESEVLLFTGGDHEVDLGKILRELIILEESFKRLCREDCKGLCSICGINKNSAECECLDDSSDSPFEVLKQN